MKFYRRWPIRSLILVAALPLPSLASADATDDYVKAQMRWLKIPGLSLAVCKNGRIIKAAGYGLADVDRKIPATAKTVYKIASVSKQFVAANVMRLIQERKIGLDDSVCKYLSSAPASWKPITIRRLMNHTSGLVREIPAADPTKPTSNSEVVNAAFSAPLQFPVGEKWGYSNIGYYVLAEVIAKVTRGSWPDSVRRNVFGPVGMNNTYKVTENNIPNMASGYEFRNRRLQPAEKWVALRPSGAFASTVLDMAKWDSALRSTQLFDAKSKHEIWSPASLANGQTKPYGFGWFLDPWNGHERTYHSGGVPGFVAEFQRFTKEGISVIVLCNLGSRDLSDFAIHIAGLYSKNLVPPLRPAIRDTNPGFTTKVKVLIESLSRSTFEPSMFTPNAARGIQQDIASGFPNSLREQGKLVRVELLESQSEGTGHHYLYRILYQNLILFAAFSVNSQGQIEKWSLAD